MRMLIIDDDTQVRRALTVYLRLLGHVVDGAGDWGEAQGILRAFTPDIIVTDLMLPGPADGATICHEAKSRLGLPVLMVSAAPWEKVETSMTEKGLLLPDSFLPVPYNPRELVRLAERILEDARRANDAVVWEV